MTLEFPGTCSLMEMTIFWYYKGNGFTPQALTSYATKAFKVRLIGWKILPKVICK